MSRVGSYLVVGGNTNRSFFSRVADALDYGINLLKGEASSGKKVLIVQVVKEVESKVGISFHINHGDDVLEQLSDCQQHHAAYDPASELNCRWTGTRHPCNIDCGGVPRDAERIMRYTRSGWRPEHGWQWFRAGKWHFVYENALHVAQFTQKQPRIYSRLTPFGTP